MVFINTKGHLMAICGFLPLLFQNFAASKEYISLNSKKFNSIQTLKIAFVIILNLYLFNLGVAQIYSKTKVR